ncbi:MAG TPA: DoxX family protein [Polyangiales bacterium]
MEFAQSTPVAVVEPAVSGHRAMRWAQATSRVLLGLSFFVFGLDGFLHFVPQPDPSTIPPAAMSFGAALAGSGYLFQLIKGTEVVVGALLLLNRYVPLALVLLAPVTVNIVLFHAFLAPDGTGLGLVLAALQLFLAWTHRDAYAGLLRARHR